MALYQNVNEVMVFTAPVTARPLRHVVQFAIQTSSASCNLQIIVGVIVREALNSSMAIVCTQEFKQSGATHSVRVTRDCDGVVGKVMPSDIFIEDGNLHTLAAAMLPYRCPLNILN